MPQYCYTSESQRETIERHYPMGRAPSKIHRNGVVFWRDLRAEQAGHRSGDAWTEYVSYSRGVPLDQMAAAEKLDAELGVPTRYEVRGPVALPKITSKEHDKKWLRAHKWVSHDPGDGYPVPGDFDAGRG